MLPLTRIRAILWDLDNTLVVTGGHHAEKFNLVAKKHGITPSTAFGGPQSSLPASRKAQFKHLSEFYSLQIPYCEFERDCETAFLDLIKSYPLKTRAELMGFWHYAIQHDIPQAVVSNSPRNIVLASLQNVRLLEHLAFIVCEDDVRQRKPNAAPYNLAYQLLDQHLKSNDQPPLQSPQDILVFEDSLEGVCAAKAASMTVCHAPYMMPPRL